MILNFWATWCPPCVDETPSLIHLQRQIAPKGGTILGISVDDDPQAYAQFVSKLISISPPIAIPKQISPTYGTSMYPETYIIDRNGRIERKIIGPQDWTGPTMMAYVDSVLKEN